MTLTTEPFLLAYSPTYSLIYLLLPTCGHCERPDLPRLKTYLLVYALANFLHAYLVPPRTNGTCYYPHIPRAVHLMKGYLHGSLLTYYTR